MQNSLLEKIPGYTLVRSFAEQLTGESHDQTWKPALAEIEEALVPAFVIEQLDDGRFTFVPGRNSIVEWPLPRHDPLLSNQSLPAFFKRSLLFQETFGKYTDCGMPREVSGSNQCGVFSVRRWIVRLALARMKIRRARRADDLRLACLH